MQKSACESPRQTEGFRFGSPEKCDEGDCRRRVTQHVGGFAKQLETPALAISRVRFSKMLTAYGTDSREIPPSVLEFYVDACITARNQRRPANTLQSGNTH